MLALIYGMMPSAKTVTRRTAPPENMSSMPNRPPPGRCIISAITEASTPGIGM